jgi:hypothetical protein
MKFLKEAFAKEYVGSTGSRVDVMWVFSEVKIIDVDRIQPYRCVTIPSSHKMHSISSLDHANLKLFSMWELSCFCPTCIDGGEEEDYDNIKHVLHWKTIKLVPTKRVVVREMMDDCNFEIAWGANGQHLADSICQGDNFAVVTNDPFGGE